MSILPKEHIDSLEEGSTLWEIAVGQDINYKLLDYLILSNGYYLVLEFDNESRTLGWFDKCILCIYTSTGAYVTCVPANSATLEKTIKTFFNLSSGLINEILSNEEMLERFRKKIFATNFR